MKTTKKFLVILLALSMLFLAAGCGDKDVETLDSVDVAQQEGTVTTEAGQTISLSYPVVSAVTNNADKDKMLEKLNAQFQQDAEAFVQQVTEEYASITGDAVFTYYADVRYNTKGMLSVVQMEDFAGETYRQYAATYSLGSGDKMTLGELMNMKEREAESTVIKQFGGVVQSDPSTFNTDAADYIKEHLDEVQYYRYNEGLGVFCQPGTIAPESAGVLEMVIQ